MVLGLYSQEQRANFLWSPEQSFIPDMEAAVSYYSAVAIVSR